MNDFSVGVMYGLIIGIVFGVCLHLAINDIRDQNSKHNKEILKLHYSKDYLGNCYAYEVHSQRFTWLPCELIKDYHENNN